MKYFYKFFSLFISVIVFFGLLFFLFNINKVDATPGAMCGRSLPCSGEGERCDYGTCRISCDSSNPCSDGQVCVGGSCVERSVVSGCTNDVDCGGGRHCAYGNCTDGNIGDACDSQSDCNEGTCWGGECRTACSGPDDTTTCGSGQTCNLDNVCTTDQCNSDRDCPENHTCNLDHRCVSNDRIIQGSGGGIQDYGAWQQRQIDAANSAERGIFTEGLTTECMAFGKCNTCDILKVIGNVFRFAFEIVGIIAVAVIAIGGFTYVRSGGSEETINTAKKTITAAVLGTLIVFAAWVIINTILNITGFNAGGGSWWNPSC